MITLHLYFATLTLHKITKSTPATGPKFTNDLNTILRHFRRTFTTILRPIFRQNLTIAV